MDWIFVLWALVILGGLTYAGRWVLKQRSRSLKEDSISEIHNLKYPYGGNVKKWFDDHKQQNKKDSLTNN